jgi:arginase
MGFFVRIVIGIGFTPPRHKILFTALVLSKNIQILCAPSILGLKPSGVEELPRHLLSRGLAGRINAPDPTNIQVFNEFYSHERNDRKMLNETCLAAFSKLLCSHVEETVKSGKFPLVLGGDCSVLIGCMAALKGRGNFGLIFCDAHADFYMPEQSTTGEAADMDLAIVTGRGADALTNLNNLRPYVRDEHVFHLGQRDAVEAERFGSQRIQDTKIHRYDLAWLKEHDLSSTISAIKSITQQQKLDGYWLHFDADVISDDDNPAVDYRLPGGLSFESCDVLIGGLFNSIPITGMTVTILNPKLDGDGKVIERLASLLEKVMSMPTVESV